MKSCNKIREAYGLKILVNEETYNEYKGTYEEQIEELQERIDKAIEYIENNSLYKEEVDYDYEETPIYVGCNDIKAREELLNILKGSEENDK